MGNNKVEFYAKSKPGIICEFIFGLVITIIALPFMLMSIIGHISQIVSDWLCGIEITITKALTQKAGEQ